MNLIQFSWIRACLALGTLLTACAARAATIYSLDFEPGGNSAYSELIFGYPEVRSDFSALPGHSLVFNTAGNSAPFYYDQIQLNLGIGSDFYRLGFDIATENLIDSPNLFRLLIDTPQVRSLDFHGDGRIIFFTPHGDSGILGSFSDHSLMHFDIDLDLAATEWSISRDASVVHTGTFQPSGGDVFALRFSLGLNAASPDHTSLVGIDNITISTRRSSVHSVPDSGSALIPAFGVAFLWFIRRISLRPQIAE